MLGEREQQQIEHAQRECHEPVLNGMKRTAREMLPHEQREQAQRDEEPGIFHRALGLPIEIHRLHEIHAEGRLLQGRCDDSRAEPTAAKRAIQVEDLPARVEAPVAHGTIGGKEAAAEKPGSAQLPDSVALAERDERQERQ